MEEHKKNTKWHKIITCVVIVLLIFSLVQIATLNDRIENLTYANSRLNDEIKSLRTSINSIYDNVDEKLKKEASILSGVDYSVGKPNKDMKTVPLSLTVVPKLVSDDMKLSVTVDGVTAPLTRNGNEFSGTIDIGLFIDYNQYPLLTSESSEGTKTEYLEDVYVSNLFDNYLPTLEASMSSSTRMSNGVLSVDADLRVRAISANKNPSATFKSFILVEELNGEEIGREDITDTVIESECNYSAKYRKSFNIPDGNEYMLRVYILAEDSLGYIHEISAQYWEESRMDAMIHNAVDNDLIYDKDGNVLWQKYISWES